jgi:hypothetical protein
LGATGEKTTDKTDARLEALHMAVCLERCGRSSTERLHPNLHPNSRTHTTHTLTDRIRDSLLSRVATARQAATARGDGEAASAFRRAVKRAVHYSLAVEETGEHLTLLANLLILTEGQAQLVEEALQQVAALRSRQPRRSQVPPSSIKSDISVPTARYFSTSRFEQI